MERRAASHTEEEEMNQRRKLLNAARRGDTKAIGKLFELYQVRVLSGDQLAKVNRTMVYMAPVGPEKGGKSSTKGSAKAAKHAAPKSGKPQPEKRGATPKPATRKSVKAGSAQKLTGKHKHKAKHK